MAYWPSLLPAHLNADDYSERRLEGVIRSQMDAGPAFVRRRYSAVPIVISGSLVLSVDQVAVLDEFYFETTAQGALAFDWRHPRTQAFVSMRFLGPPGYQSLSHDLYQASLSIEILP